MLKILTLAGGVAGAVALSQFPEFSQQYLQRLSGAVDELRTQVVAFDTLATAAGITREEALAELDGSTFQSGGISISLSPHSTYRFFARANAAGRGPFCKLRTEVGT